MDPYFSVELSQVAGVAEGSGSLLALKILFGGPPCKDGFLLYVLRWSG